MARWQIPIALLTTWAAGAYRNNRMGPAYCVEMLAWIAASGRQYERAAVQLGAAVSLWRSMSTTLDGHQPRAGRQRDCERQARQALGRTPAQAAPGTPARAGPEPEAPLTPRELQVARLIAAWPPASQPDGEGRSAALAGSASRLGST
jgi:DNA-binding NarL/FixJ family response regulator